MRKYSTEIIFVLLIALIAAITAILAPPITTEVKAQLRSISFDQEHQKIDSQAVNGLLGTKDSLAYKIHEVEKHLHSAERWVGKKGTQTATDWADDVLTPYVAISGSDDYGGDTDDEALVLGTADTPIITGSAYYDLHRILIIDVDHSTPYKLRIVYGTGTMAQAITAKQFSEVMVMFDAANPTVSAGKPFDIHMPRLATDTKVWIQAWNATDNSQVDFLVGLHEYPG